MKYTVAILSSLMATAVVAQPHARHQHNARHEKRDVVWTTEVEMVTETVDYTTTVWVTGGGAAAPSTAKASPTTLATSPKPSSAAATPSSVVSSIIAASSGSSVSEVLNQSPPTSTVKAASPTSIKAAPTSTTSAAVVPSPTSVSTPVVVPTTSSVIVVPTTSSVAVAPTSSTSAVAATTVASSSSSASTCGAGSPCSGDITFYTAGLGACGETTDGSSVAGVALPYGLMGTLSNNNPYCGKTITVKCTTTGKTVVATVIDKCMGCEGDAIDLTNFAFDQLADESVGRTQATWYFND